MAYVLFVTNLIPQTKEQKVEGIEVLRTSALSTYYSVRLNTCYSYVGIITKHVWKHCNNALIMRRLASVRNANNSDP